MQQDNTDEYDGLLRAYNDFKKSKKANDEAYLSIAAEAKQFYFFLQEYNWKYSLDLDKPDECESHFRQLLQSGTDMKAQLVVTDHLICMAYKEFQRLDRHFKDRKMEAEEFCDYLCNSDRNIHIKPEEAEKIINKIHSPKRMRGAAIGVGAVTAFLLFMCGGAGMLSENKNKEAAIRDSGKDLSVEKIERWQKSLQEARKAPDENQQQK